MQATVKVFTLAPGAPAGPPQPAPDLVVEGKTHDGLREAARVELVAKGYRVRALSFAAKGAGLVAYVEAAG